MRPILGIQSHKRIEKIRNDILMRFVELSRPEDSSMLLPMGRLEILWRNILRESSLMRNPILGREGFKKITWKCHFIGHSLFPHV